MSTFTYPPLKNELRPDYHIGRDDIDKAFRDLEARYASLLMPLPDPPPPQLWGSVLTAALMYPGEAPRFGDLLLAMLESMRDEYQVEYEAAKVWVADKLYAQGMSDVLVSYQLVRWLSYLCQCVKQRATASDLCRYLLVIYVLVTVHDYVRKEGE